MYIGQNIYLLLQVADLQMDCSPRALAEHCLLKWLLGVQLDPSTEPIEKVFYKTERKLLDE